VNQLYFLGGVPRSGKSTISAAFLKRKPIAVITLDALTEGVRNIFDNQPYQILKEIKVEGWIKYKADKTNQVITKQLDSLPLHENTVTLQALLGMLDHYRRNKQDVLVEGCIFDPDWVSRHDFNGFNVHAVFVGFSSKDHINEIIEHARNNKHDWINKLLEHSKGDESKVQEKLALYIEQSEHLSTSAINKGYGYFDLSSQPFKNYVKSVVDYLLLDDK
jgi:2-phosphoglycerate kinase